MKLPKLRGRKKKAVAVDQEEDLTIRERLERGRGVQPPDDAEVPEEASEALEATEPEPEETTSETVSGEPESSAEETAPAADDTPAEGPSDQSAEDTAKAEESSEESGEPEDADTDDDFGGSEEPPKKSGKKKLVLLGMLIVVVAVAAGVFLLRDRLPTRLPFGGGGDSSAASSSAASSAGSQSAVSSSSPEDAMTVMETVDYINSMSPAALGLPGDSMAQYEVLPNEGTVLVDDMPCTELSVYAKDDVTDTNDYMGSYLLSRGSTPRIFRLDKETGQATEISASSDVGQAVLTQAAEED